MKPQTGFSIIDLSNVKCEITCFEVDFHDEIMRLCRFTPLKLGVPGGHQSLI